VTEQELRRRQYERLQEAIRKANRRKKEREEYVAMSRDQEVVKWLT